MKKSVVYRGSILSEKQNGNFFAESIETLRNWFDGEVIVCTWREQEKYLLGIPNIDKVVLLDDPGKGPVQNFKRQVTSFDVGANIANGELVLITRTDMIHSKDIFSYYGDKSLHTGGMKLFENKILIGNMMSVNPASQNIPEPPYSYRLCDWFHLGNKKDMIDFGDSIRFIGSVGPRQVSENCTEKSWIISFLKKREILMENEDDTARIDFLFWNFILDNFVIKNTKSTLFSQNMNYGLQPEFLPHYLTEEIYNSQYEKLASL